MGSFFRTQFDSSFPLTFGNFVDSGQLATYTDRKGNVTPNLHVIWRAESTDLVEDSEGDLFNARIVQIVVATEELPTIDTKAKFTYQGEDWDVDAREGRGIESNNPTFSVVHLIHRSLQTVSRSGRRIE